MDKILAKLYSTINTQILLKLKNKVNNVKNSCITGNAVVDLVMEELTKAEERVMQILWRLKKCFVKDIINALPDNPKPPYNTISSVVRLLEKKGYLGFKAYGKTHEYFPAISKAEYRKAFFKKFFSGYFDNSAESLFSFMVKEQQLSEEDLNKIQSIINKNTEK